MPYASASLLPREDISRRFKNDRCVAALVGKLCQQGTHKQITTSGSDCKQGVIDGLSDKVHRTGACGGVGTGNT